MADWALCLISEWTDEQDGPNDDHIHDFVIAFDRAGHEYRDFTVAIVAFALQMLVRIDWDGSDSTSKVRTLKLGSE
jgi:hypothetical protein